MGIHLEGPFVSHGKRGVHPEVSIREPSIELVRSLAGGGAGTHSLDDAGAGVAACAGVDSARDVLQGVRVSMGHSTATAEETLAAIAAGAKSSTHLFNAMRPLDHREPGIVGTILDRD